MINLSPLLKWVSFLSLAIPMQACGTAPTILTPVKTTAPPDIGLASSSAAPTPTLFSPTPTQVLFNTFTHTATPWKTSTQTATPSQTMTSTPAFQFKGVGLFEVQNVIAVRWSEDGESLYFAELVNETSPSYLDWFEYDLASDSIRSAPSPLNYDAGIWERLGVAEPRIASNIFPELIGNISPSGKYILYPIYSGDPDPFSGGPFSFDIWLANLHSQYKYKLAESGWALLTRAAWFSDESKVLFELMAYEGGLGKLILAEVKTGIKQYVAIPSGEYWQLSPDDTTLAVITPDEAGYNSLVEYSLAEETWKVIDADVWPYAPFAWSRNGQLLFYWADPTHEGEARLLRVYDQVSGKTNDLISHATLVAEIGATSAGALSVSPDGRRIAIFDGALWVIILP